ncbi:hypothetical protein [Leifsonia aquatica]|uniref:hypothetical protein n=1 Tax=Leifsonia aquatica TaxID=144185 RepID=UPI0028A818C4|nr:hypothetical protein [Leifsonia aquatica]
MSEGDPGQDSERPLILASVETSRTHRIDVESGDGGSLAVPGPATIAGGVGMYSISGTVWSVAAILVAVGALVAVPVGIASGPVFAAWIGFFLLLAAVIAILAMLLLPLRRDEAFGDVRTLADFPAVVAWPLRIGWWIGSMATGLVAAVMVVTTPGVGSASAGSRFGMSVMAVAAILAGLFTSAQLPTWTLLTLAILGSAVVVIATGRGVVGMIAQAVRLRP